MDGALVGTILVVLAIMSFSRRFRKIPRRPKPGRWQRILRPFVTVVRIVFQCSRGAPRRAGGCAGTCLARLPDQRRWGDRGAHPPVRTGRGQRRARGRRAADDPRRDGNGVPSVREVMVPRTDIRAVAVDDGFENVADVMVEEGYSRVPVFEENIDNIVGIAHAQGSAQASRPRRENPDLRACSARLTTCRSPRRCTRC